MGSVIQKIFICGFMGSGKTTLLQEMSALGSAHDLALFEFVDLDDYIFSYYTSSKDASLADFINRIGIESFRDIELQSIDRLLSDSQSYVISLGGGAVNSKTIESLSARARGFWLDTDFEVCLKRIRGDKSRPLAQRSDEKLRKLFDDRLHFYSKFQRVSGFKEILHHLSTTL